MPALGLLLLFPLQPVFDVVEWEDTTRMLLAFKHLPREGCLKLARYPERQAFDPSDVHLVGDIPLDLSLHFLQGSLSLPFLGSLPGEVIQGLLVLWGGGRESPPLATAVACPARAAGGAGSHSPAGSQGLTAAGAGPQAWQQLLLHPNL
mmetsp:Transcript_21381/g.48335  ORF Transcript_21381/g.48335 Transcript_21381/m.48335 type:complete len:149 (-) Transcript_21381:802-1248(-)